MISKRKPLNIFYSVIKALLLREIQTRFGTKKLGYFWAIIDSVAMIIVFSIIKTLMGKSMPGLDYPVFLATSFIAYNMFKNISLKSMNAFGANRGLFIYKQVKPFDTIVSRFILEVFIASIVVVVLLFVGWYFGMNIECKNILGVLLAFIWIAFFGFGLGVFFALFAFFYENFAKIINLLFLPMFFMSGLFYTLDSLPPLAREILLYNPVVHFMELIHGEYFYPLDTKYVDFNYMILWTLIPMFIGLWLYRKTEKKIIMS